MPDFSDVEIAGWRSSGCRLWSEAAHQALSPKCNEVMHMNDPLKHQPQRKLDLSRRARSRRNRPHSIAADRRITGDRKLRMIQRIEEFGPECQIGALGNTEPFG